METEASLLLVFETVKGVSSFPRAFLPLGVFSVWLPMEDTPFNFQISTRSRDAASGFRFQVSGFRFEVSGFRSLVSRPWFQDFNQTQEPTTKP